MKCTRCQRENAADMSFCGECGARLAALCPACGAANVPVNKFCGKCGAPLSPAPAVTRFVSAETYTPKHLAEKILTSKGALEGERKQVTVLFADLKGSMELMADRDPEEARKLLDPVLERMMEAVHHFEGTVNQVMGDGIMALFGAPLAHEDHVVRACYAALRMQDAVRRYTEEVRRAHGVEVRVRVGLNSGEVVVRSIGSDLHMDYTAVGQTTHLAARMEQLATPGTIRLTAETLRLAEGYVQVRPLGPVPVKGLVEPVDVYELTGVGAVRTRLQAAAARGFTRFVGRDAEMEQLRAAAKEGRRGRGQLVTVVGEPGVGKSRLFHEFVHSHHSHGWLVLESGSISYGKTTAYLPLGDLLKRYFKIEDRDDTRAIRAKVTGTVLTLDESLKDSVPPVLWLLEALPEGDELRALEPAQRRLRTIEAIRRLVLRESRVQPLLLVFEDLHWVDSETQAFLDSLVESLPTAPILLAVNYRPEYEHGWGSKTYYRQLRIDPLPPESAGELLETLLGVDPSVEPLKLLLIERTEGNPLFLEESVRALVETRGLVGERGAYRLAKAPEIQIPATVQAILAARIDRLPAQDKRLLQAASVVGKDVPFALLQAVAELSDDELRHGLARLGAAELVYEARLFPDLEYTFKHALTHEVAYSSLLGERRRTLHAAIADALERLYAERPGEQVELLAHHAARGEVWDRAARALLQAGVKAAARSAYREAVGLFEQALKALEHLPETDETRSLAIDVHVDMGPVVIALKGGASKEVESIYRRARELCERIGERRRLFPVLWGLWFVNNQRGEYHRARELAEHLLAVAEQNRDPAQLLQAHHSLWPILVEHAEFDAAEAHARHGLELYDPQKHRSHAFLYGNHDPGVCCRAQAARARWLRGLPDQAVALSRDAVRLARELAHPYSTTLALYYDAILHYWRGEELVALERAREVVAITEEHPMTTHFAFGSRMLLHMLLGHADLASLMSSLAALRAGGGATGREVFLGSQLAEAHARAGQWATALDVLGDALALAETGVQRHYRAELYRLKGELLEGAGAAPDEVERLLKLSVESAREIGATSLELRAATSLARRLVVAGRRDEARRLLAPIYGRFTEGFATADLKSAKTLIDELG
jgi:class 3 adenylate cyclase/predicted ATPase